MEYVKPEMTYKIPLIMKCGGCHFAQLEYLWGEDWTEATELAVGGQTHQVIGRKIAASEIMTQHLNTSTAGQRDTTEHNMAAARQIITKEWNPTLRFLMGGVDRSCSQCRLDRVTQ